MATANPIFGNAEANRLKDAEALIAKQAEEIKQLKIQTSKKSMLNRQQSSHNTKKSKQHFGEKSSGAGGGTDEGDWVQAVSSKSGKTYYYNKKTKETSWENPTERMSLGLEEHTKKQALSSKSQQNLFKKSSFKKDRESKKETRGSGFQMANPMSLTQ